MKKLFLFASAAALMATSCSDDLGLKNNQVSEGNAALVASFQVGSDDTRTSMVDNPNSVSGKSYAWSKGDALGVFAVDGSYTTNAMFSYVSGTSGDFTGDIKSLDGDTYYGYYPYNQGAVLTNEGTGINLYINPNQNYNHDAVEDVNWSWNNPLSGSFAPGAAPAVAYGTADANGQLQMTFKAVASYFVFPVTSFEDVTVTKVVLSVKNSEGTDMALAGTVPVTLSPLQQNYSPIVTTDDLNDLYTTLTLNCGQGVNLTEGSGTNFWFVVPAELPLSGSTVTFTVYTEENDPVSFSKTFGDGAGYSAQNQIYRILATNNQPWVYTTDPTTAFIQTPEQFLEWAYLVTNGAAAIKEYAEMMANGYDLSLSDFVNLVNFEDGKSVSDLTTSNVNIVTSIKNAFVMNNLTFSPASVSKTTGITTSSLVPFYYQGVYKNYISEGYIPSIGGQNAVTVLSGATPQTSISGLKIVGNGMFSVPSTQYITVKNITLDVTVQAATAQSFYYLLGYPVGLGFNNVTVAAGSQVLDNTGAVVPAGKAGVFAVDNSKWYTYSGGTTSETVKTTNYTTGVINQSSLLLANVLDVETNNSSKNAVFYFTSIIPTTSYNTVNIVPNTADARAGYGAVLNLPGTSNEATAAALMKKVANTGNAVYSIVDSSNTSYWTGLLFAEEPDNAWLTPGTAEQLASMLQNETTDPQTFNMTRNINLMGTYHNNTTTPVKSFWYAYNAPTNLTVNVGTGNYTISNVYMNGYAAADQTAKQNPTLVYTVLGYSSTVKGTGSLTIRDVVVDVNAPNGALVAAVSVVPGAASNVNVYGFGATLSSAVKSVGQTPYLNGVGGLYQWLNPTTLAYVKGQYLNGNGINGMTTANGAKVGLISGVLNFTLAAPSSLSCPLYTPQAQEPFGVVNVTVTPQSSNSSYLQLTGNFRAGDFQNWNFTTSAQTGYSLYVLDVDGTQWLNTTVTRTPATAANGTFNNTKWTKLSAVQTPVGGTYTPLR